MSQTAPISEYEQERRAKLQKLRDLGVAPYGRRTENLTPLAAIKAQFTPEMGQDGGPLVKGAGRVVLKRDMGKLSFLTLRDESGDLQVAFDKKRLDEKAWAINDLIDLGDQIIVEGKLGTTKKGETTIWATAIDFAAKSLLPPPGKWDGLSDVEARYRQRYVDLWSNPEVMRTLKLRMQIVEEVRDYLRKNGYLEVETPMMQTLHGGAAARPFETHHNALDMKLYMRIAPELFLKRLLVGGFTKVFELNRNFRNEGISPRHNPEFTMLEAYEAYGSWETMANMVEGMICHIAEKLFGGLKIEHKNAAGEVTKTINLQRPWRRVTMVDLVEEYTGWRFKKQSIKWEAPELLHFIIGERVLAHINNRRVSERVADLRGKAERHVEIAEIHARDDRERAMRHVELASRFVEEWDQLNQVRTQESIDALYEKYRSDFLRLSPAEQLVDVYEKSVEPNLVDPTFVVQVPSVVIPLARKVQGDDFFADVYELAINGQEISPGYSELNDPDVQAANFATQVGDKEEQQKTDDDFLTALRYGMPPAGGMGLGIDRLVMMLTGAESIRDVILFPLMRPQG